MKKRICFIIGVISRTGGTERAGSLIANELAKCGHDVYVLSFWNSGKPHFTLDDKIHVEYLLNPKTEGKLYRTIIYPILKLHDFIKKNNIDIVVDVDTALSNYSAYAIKGTKCKLISWEHFNYWSMVTRNERPRFTAKKLIKKYASALVVLTDEDREKHEQEYGLKEGFVKTIHNPCMSIYNCEYNFNNHVFLSVGRISHEKGFDMLLKAWYTVSKELPNWKLVIVGDGIELENLKRICQDLQLERVELEGHSDEVEKYYKNAACYVLSSRYEGFPMVILEAQSYGLPVISFNCKTGPKDLIEDNINGCLVKNGDIDELAQAMIKFAKDEDKANLMSKNTVKSIKKFSVDSVAEQWNNLVANI